MITNNGQDSRDHAVLGLGPVTPVYIFVKSYRPYTATAVRNPQRDQFLAMWYAIRSANLEYGQEGMSIDNCWLMVCKIRLDVNFEMVLLEGQRIKLDY